MKKVGAILAAVAMVVAAFLIRDVGNEDVAADGGGDDEVGTLVCPDELLEICRTIDSDVELVTTPAGTTANGLLTATADDDLLAGEAWVVPAAWSDLVMATRTFEGRTDLFEVSAPIASTQVALAVYTSVVADLGCNEVDWSCLADAARNGLDVGSPPIRSALGLPIAAAQIVQIEGTAELDPKQVRLPPFTRESSPFRTMRSQGPGKFIAAGTTVADTQGGSGNTFGEISITRKPSDIRIDLVVVTREGTTLSGHLRDAVADAFIASHWDLPGSGPSGMPNGDLLNLIRNS